MRILHVNKFLYRRGGAEGYMLDVVDQLRSRGHEVRLFGMSHPDNDLRLALTPLPSHVAFEPSPESKVEQVRLFGRMVWSREVERCMEQALEQWRPEVIHCHNIYHQLSPSLLAAARRRDIPVVLTLHDYKLVCPTYQFLDKGQLCTACVTGGPWQAAKRACKDGSRAASTAAATEVWLHRRFGAYEPVRRFISPSRFLAGEMSRAGVFADRVQVLDNFTDVASVAPRGGAGAGVVYAGRLSHEKGVDLAIEAWATLCSSGTVPDGMALQVVGDGPERAALEALAEAAAPGRVVFHGRVTKDRVSELVREAAATVAPSRWYENQPLAVLESFAAGVPVIATTLGGLPEIVEDGTTGWLVDLEDRPALVRALEEAVTRPDLSHARGTAARRVAEERFSPEGHVDAVEDLYRELVA